MFEHVKSIQLHQWLFGTAAVLTLLALPYAILVYTQHLPTAYLNLHLVTALGLWMFGELRRQWVARAVVQREWAELVSEAEHARR